MFEKFIEGRDFRHAVQVFWQTRKVEVFGSILSCSVPTRFAVSPLD